MSTANNKEIKGSIDGIPFVGPGIVSVKRAKSDRIIIVDNPGCAKQTLLRSDIDNKFFLNGLAIGFIAFVSTTDYATEKMWKYTDQVIIPCQ